LIGRCVHGHIYGDVWHDVWHDVLPSSAAAVCSGGGGGGGEMFKNLMKSIQGKMEEGTG